MSSDLSLSDSMQIGVLQRLNCGYWKKFLLQASALICIGKFCGVTALAGFGDSIGPPDTIVVIAPGLTESIDQAPDVKPYEWGQPIGGVSMSLKLLKSRYATGEPITAQVQLKNASTNRYALRNAPFGNQFSVVCVRDRSGRVAESGFSRDYGKYATSGFGGYPLREFGGSGHGSRHQVYNLDLSVFFQSLEPGRYHVFLKTQYKNQMNFVEGHFVELMSNTESFEVYAEPGDEVPDPSEGINPVGSRIGDDVSTSRAPNAAATEANATAAGPEDTVPSTDATPASKSLTPSAETGAVAHDSARLGVMFWVYGALILTLIGVTWFFARR